MENREAILAKIEAEAPITWEVAQEIGQEFGIKPRSVVAMTTRNGFEYKRKERVSKTGDKVESKADLVARIAEKTCVSVNDLDGLDKANKGALQVLAK